MFFRKNFHQILQGLQLLRGQLFVSFGYHSNYFYQILTDCHIYLFLNQKRKTESPNEKNSGKKQKRSPSKKMKQQNLHDFFKKKLLKKKINSSQEEKF